VPDIFNHSGGNLIQLHFHTGQQSFIFLNISRPH